MFLSAINHSCCQEKNKAGKKEIFSGYFLLEIRPYHPYDLDLTKWVQNLLISGTRTYFS
jgi:hypothetical protein